MPESPSYKELQLLITHLLEELEQPEERWMVRPDTETVNLFARALRATLLTLGTSLGECRLDTPYSPLHPVIGEDGTFRWCCNHDPEHCRP